MPYISKAERKAASYMTWSEILTHVKQAEQCDDEGEARRQIGNAIEDFVLKARWADERSRWGTSSPIQVPDDAPPRDADYWMNCETDSKNRDSVREPPSYDRDLVSRRRAQHLDKARRFRAPLFPRQLVLKLWPESRVSATSATESKAKKFLANLLRANPKMKKAVALAACRKEFRLSERAFKERVWPDAREEAKLDRQGRPGRKPTPKIQTS